MKNNDILNSQQIIQFMGCGLCFDELPDDTSSANYARLTVGFTEIGLQVWCHRHNCNVINLDFENKGPFPANTTRQHFGTKLENRAIKIVRTKTH